MILYKDRYYSHELIIPKSTWIVIIININSLQILNRQHIREKSILKGIG